MRRNFEMTFLVLFVVVFLLKVYIYKLTSQCSRWTSPDFEKCLEQGECSIRSAFLGHFQKMWLKQGKRSIRPILRENMGKAIERGKFPLRIEHIEHFSSFKHFSKYPPLFSGVLEAVSPKKMSIRAFPCFKYFLGLVSMKLEPQEPPLPPSNPPTLQKPDYKVLFENLIEGGMGWGGAGGELRFSHVITAAATQDWGERERETERERERERERGREGWRNRERQKQINKRDKNRHRGREKQRKGQETERERERNRERETYRHTDGMRQTDRQTNRQTSRRKT